MAYDRISGIYQIKSVIYPERIYIGSAVDFRKRWREHKLDLRKGQHKNPILQNHVNKYGIGDLIFSITEECSRESLLDRERYYIKLLDPFFNILKDDITRPTDLSGEKNPFYGKHHTDETKAILRELKTGTRHTEETKRKFSEDRKGHRPYGMSIEGRKSVGEKNKVHMNEFYQTEAGIDYKKRLPDIAREIRKMDTEETKQKRADSIKKTYKKKAIGKLISVLLEIKGVVV